MPEHAAVSVPVLREIAANDLHRAQEKAITALGLLAFQEPAKNREVLLKMLNGELLSQRILAAQGLWSLGRKPEYLGRMLDDIGRVRKPVRCAVIRLYPKPWPFRGTGRVLCGCA
jgi:hypothetical protein